ncbi:MAG TPA: hypothetical protein VFI34_07625 [Candidatus Limnocylindrales bacterium]|nr:hypothetical protein [Candidatus Limnocylindrales bacterium]
MNFPDVVAACDAIRDLVPVPEGIEKDDGVTDPTTIAPRRLYVFPRRIGPQQGLSQADLGEYTRDTTVEIRIVLTLGAKGEPRVQRPDRTLSEDLAAGAGAIVKALLEHDSYPAGSGSLWQDLAIVQVLPDFTRNERARGWAVDCRILMPWGDEASSSGTSS